MVTIVKENVEMWEVEDWSEGGGCGEREKNKDRVLFLGIFVTIRLSTKIKSVITFIPQNPIHPEYGKYIQKKMWKCEKWEDGVRGVVVGMGEENGSKL